MNAVIYSETNAPKHHWKNTLHLKITRLLVGMVVQLVYVDGMTWKLFLHYHPFVRGIYLSLVDFPHKVSLLCRALMSSFVLEWISCWTKSKLLVIRDAMALMWHHCYVGLYGYLFIVVTEWKLLSHTICWLWLETALPYVIMIVADALVPKAAGHQEALCRLNNDHSVTWVMLCNMHISLQALD